MNTTTQLEYLSRQYFADPKDQVKAVMAMEEAIEADRNKREDNLRLLKQKAAAFDEWVEKTNWVQEQMSTFPVASLGKHRADVMREEILRLRSLMAAAPVSLTDEEILKAAKASERMEWFVSTGPVQKAAFIDSVRALLSSASQAQVPDGCTWTLTDEDNAIWESECGQAWTFIDGGPVDNNVKFCHGCGKPMVEAAPQPKE